LTGTRSAVLQGTAVTTTGYTSTPARYVLPGPDLLLPFSYLSCLSSLSRHLHLAWSGSGAFCWSLSSQFVHPTISRQYSEMLSLTGNLMYGSQSLSCSTTRQVFWFPFVHIFSTECRTKSYYMKS